ncbi:MAG: ATP-binding protein [Phycisphaerae bacterium]|jgi:signal transduction histidine kinase
MEKIKKFRSLTVTLAIAFLALSAVVLLISNSLQIYFNLGTQRNMVAGQQKLIAQEAANTVRAFIQKKSDLLKTAAGLGSLTNSTEAEQKLVMEKLLGFEPAFRQLVLLNTKEEELLRESRLSNLLSGQLTEQINKNKNEILPQAVQRKTYISQVYIDKVTSEPLIIMAAPIIDVFGDFKMVLIAEVNLKFMWDLVASMKVGDNGLAYVVDRQGNLIAFGDISRVLKGENLLYLAEVAEFIANEDSFDRNSARLSKGIRNTYIAATHVPLGTPDWAVVVESPILEAYGSILASFKLTLWTVLLSFALAIMAGIYLSKRITKPIIHLRDAAEKIGQGRMNIKIETQSQNEIGQLTESLNQMVEDLNRTTVSRDALMEEVAERKHAEQALKETADKLEQVNQELKNFVYVASHDLREPLRKISAFAQLLERSLADKLDDNDSENLKFMIDGATRMTQMIDGLLSYSRVSTKTREFETVRLDTVIHELEKFELSVLLEETHAILNVPEPLPSIKADSVQMRQLLQNLIANGIKYQTRGNIPEITITAETLPDEMVRIKVSDNGIGIKAESLGLLFTMFKRLHSRDEYEGTGIGLAVCKKIVERHGGQIGLESKFGRGSTFWFTVPAAKSAVPVEVA